jgi:hypothetical protein
VPDLNFHVESVAPVEFAASPLLGFRLRVENPSPDETVYTVALHCQVQIEATRRRYSADEQRRLADLFGEPARWSQTLRALLWTHASTVVPRFTDVTTVDLPVACTFDFNIGAIKYFFGLEDGDLPLLFLFSGTIFYQAADGSLQVSLVSWEKEARFRLPVTVWRELMDLHYPNSAWLCLRRDAFELLLQYKQQHGIPTWEEAIERATAAAREVAVRS